MSATENSGLRARTAAYGRWPPFVVFSKARPAWLEHMARIYGTTRRVPLRLPDAHRLCRHSQKPWQRWSRRRMQLVAGILRRSV